MFVDLVGSTALSARLDPEDMREVIRAYQNTVAGEITRFEGTSPSSWATACWPTSAGPRAHEDEAERAVRAGLAVDAAVARLTAPGGEPLAARVGIATGLVVVGDLVGEGAAQEEAVVGETPNLAARLQALAEPGAVVVAERTRRLLGGLFELRRLGAARAQGLRRAGARLGGCSARAAAEGRFEARHAAGGLTPLVGREQELALLLDRWERAKEGEGQVVLLVGRARHRQVAPGPRPARAAGRRAAHAAQHQFCSPLPHQQRAAPGDRPARAGGGVRAATTRPSAKLDKLEALLAPRSGTVGEAAPLLADLLSHPGRQAATRRWTSRRSSGRSGRSRRCSTSSRGSPPAQPVLVLFEDVHWADPTTLELLGLVVERVQRLPVLVLVTFRPEFAPPWARHAHVTALTLEPARPAAGRGDGRAGDRRQGAARPRCWSRSWRRTDGVPLFVEELTKAVLEVGPARATRATATSSPGRCRRWRSRRPCRTR